MGWALWRPLRIDTDNKQDRASRAEQTVRSAKAELGALEAMVVQGAQEAMAGHRVPQQPLPRQERQTAGTAPDESPWT